MLMSQMSNGLGALNLVRAGDPPNPRVDEAVSSPDLPNEA
jgi:hypothetical protein